MNNNGIDDEE